MHKNIKQNNYSRYAANRDVISLFSGAMGLDIGLGKAGLNVAIGQDFDAAYVKTMQGAEWRCADSAECGVAGLM